MTDKPHLYVRDGSGADKTEGRIHITNNRPSLRVTPPGNIPEDREQRENAGFYKRNFIAVRQTADLAARSKANAIRFAHILRRDGITAFVVDDFDGEYGYNQSGADQPNYLNYKKQADGTFKVWWEWELPHLYEAYHWERRHLRQQMLAAPLRAVIGGQVLQVKRPSRISIHDHHLPGLQHLAELLSLSDSDYEGEAPLLRTEDNRTFKPTKAELRSIIDAERADHKLAHERSAATEAEIERLYEESTKDIDKDDNDAVSNQRGFIRVFRGFDTEAYWNAAPLRTPKFEVIQSPAPTPPPTPAPVPEAPTGDAPAPPSRED